MKFRFTLLMLLGLFLIDSQPAMAVIASTSIVLPSTTIEKQSKDLKKEFKAQKRLNKVKNLLQKVGIDFSDPIRKWMWYSIFCAGTALVFLIVGLILSSVPLVSLAYIIAIIGLVCGIRFLVRNRS